MSDKKNGDKELDIFVLNKLYPDAESIFAFKPQTLEQIKANCLVVLDTNALIVPFDTGKESLQQIKSTYQQLTSTSRLVIPGRVAREFAKNRSEKLKTIYQQISLKRNLAISRQAYPLLESSPEYQRLTEMEKEIYNKLSDYRKQVSSLLNEIGSWYWDDPVSSIYRDLFSSNVVFDIEHDEQKLKSDLEHRQLHSIPPGFQDSSKEDKGIGDLLIWHTILELGQSRKQDIIFVSNDSKNDWWYRSDNQALYPRFELIDEYRRNSDGKTIHIINFSTFLQLFGASSEVVDEVRQEEALSSIQTNSRESLHNGYIQAESAVEEWIRSNYANSIIENYRPHFPDFIVQKTPDSFKIGFEVKANVRLNNISHLIKIVIRQFREVLIDKILDVLVLVLVSKEDDIEKIADSLEIQRSKILMMLEGRISILLGYVSSDGKFVQKLYFNENRNNKI